MDETKRPIEIPPEYYDYAEKHGLFELYKTMIQELLIDRPENPLKFFIKFLNRENTDLPKVIILGGPASGKKTISRLVVSKLRSVYIDEESIINSSSISSQETVKSYRKRKKEIPIKLWVTMVKDRLNQFDIVRRGYVMSGFPTSRELALALQTAGVSPRHCILLEAPDDVLIERAAGKRIDPMTDDVYHTTFDWPSNPEIQIRLVQNLDYTEDHIRSRLVDHHRMIDGIAECYKHNLKRVNSDQPKPDIFAQVYSFLNLYPRSLAPFTPRVILLGPTGAGKAVQAALLANKYDLVNVSCGHLIKESLTSANDIGKTIKMYLDKKMPAPDYAVFQLIKNYLTKVEAVKKGWVLHGYPLSLDQAEQLHLSFIDPNRIIFLDIPNDSVIERLTLRMTDPITGDRYHLLYNPPRIAEIRDRLMHHPKDTEDEVRHRLHRYHSHREDLEKYYQSALHINADQDPHTVFEIIESFIVNQLPKKYK